MSLYSAYQQQTQAPPQAPTKQQRVVADGWGASGSVFCADSSLRFIYESQPLPPTPGTTAAAISSLASGEFAASKPGAAGYPPQSPAMTAYDKLAYGSHQPQPSMSMMARNLVAAKLAPATATATRGADGVDLFEAEIARACATVTKQLPGLPHSFRECSVCLTQNAYAQIGVCGHTFHSKCFLRWFRQNRSCPLCRGPVDKIQCAPVVSVQDELEALMAEMDDQEPLVGSVGSDPLMANPDLISFLGSDFDDADMDMMPLDDVTLGLEKELHDHHHHHPHGPENDDDDVNMDEGDEEGEEADDHQHLTPPTSNAAAIGSFGLQLRMQQPAPSPPPPAAQFAPTSTMPNYWNVLNQGMTLPPVMPTPILAAPATPPQPMHQHRMVHIAPKPDGPLPTPQQAHHTHSHGSHVYGHAHPFVSAPRAASPSAAAPAASAVPRVVSCRCTGGCRNGRCACVKEGGMCGVSCRCTSCKNPFLMVKAAGADIDALLKDACFMHNVSKTRDMVVRMQEPVDVPCCERAIKVIDCVQGYSCTACDRKFDFSWCMNKLLDHDKTPRNHCGICKRCCDHRDVHCNDCGRCYFAGVAASLPCPCKESSRKRRDNHHSDNAVKEEAGADDDEKEGECSIM